MSVGALGILAVLFVLVMIAIVETDPIDIDEDDL
jgi:hypothetical protein